MMARRIVLLVALISAVLGLAGCTALQLRDANSQLTTYYYAKQEAVKNGDFEMIASAFSSLSTLAAGAAEQAKKEKNVMNQISFYRIAATAAWQAEDKRALEYGTDGQKLCNEGENFQNTPRDCGMLAVIPTLASIDETTKRLDALKEKTEPFDYEASSPDAAEAEAIFSNYVEALNRLVKTRPNLHDKGAHPDFLKAVDTNLVKLVCENMVTANGLVALTESNTIAESRATTGDADCLLIKSGVDPAMIGCKAGECRP